MKRIVVISDMQIPFHDVAAVINLIRFIHAWQPSEVVQIGDLMEFPQPSRWNNDTRGEYEGNIFADAERGKKFLGYLRSGYDGPITVIEGNHDRRPRDYLEKYAPALSGATSFDLDVLLDFNTFGVELVGSWYDFAPGWTMTHGHFFSLSDIAGRTAQNAANKIGKNLVIGHTHRLGISSESVGYQGEISVRVGVETGHLMDMRKAEYLAGGIGNWQQGFAVIYVDGGQVSPVVVPVHTGGSFIFESTRWGNE